MIRRPPRSTLSSSSAASDVYKRQVSTQSTGGHKRTSMLRGIRTADATFRTMQRSLHSVSSAVPMRICTKLAQVPMPRTRVSFSRGFARDTRSRYAVKRPTQTKLKEREAPQQWADPPAQQHIGGLSREEEKQEYRSQAESLANDGVRNHLAKVYGTLGGTIGVAAGGATASMVIPGMMMSPFIPGLLSLGPLIWLYSTDPYKDSETKRGALLLSLIHISEPTRPY
eukprot:TRINITY_DN4058_c0_g1_i1.p1 TRINITY_DN4058_c0_g1~~TRINITY_DN4058_c0_g1_i1.p1  ORF type:complete len:226 (+),score=40.55 TRINITY_DN4058_c0_g1_i1:71-748(+)